MTSQMELSHVDPFLFYISDSSFDFRIWIIWSWSTGGRDDGRIVDPWTYLLYDKFFQFDSRSSFKSIGPCQYDEGISQGMVTRSTF